MPQMSRNFIIRDIKIVEPFAIISVEINFESHQWKRQIRINLDQIEKLTYEQIRAEVRKTANVLINKRAPQENNLLRIAKMIGQERAL